MEKLKVKRVPNERRGRGEKEREKRQVKWEELERDREEHAFFLSLLLCALWEWKKRSQLRPTSWLDLFAALLFLQQKPRERGKETLKETLEK